jgi:hypothetical protein
MSFHWPGDADDVTRDEWEIRNSRNQLKRRSEKFLELLKAERRDA